MSHRSSLLGSLCLGLALLLGPAASLLRADIELTFGLYTSKKPTEMIKLYRPLLNSLETELSKRLNEKVSIQIQVAKTYEEGIDALVKGRFDFSQVGPVSYVEAKDKAPGVALLAVEGAKGKKTVNGVICVQAASAIQKLSELKGRSFAFGDKFSTTGRYNSQLLLIESGLTGKDLSKYEYLDRHDRVGGAVAAGDFDAGALNERTFKKLVEAGSALRALCTFPIVGRPWVSKAGLDPKVTQALSESLLSIKDPQVLNPIGEEGLVFLEGTDSDFDSTRRAVRENARFAP